MLLMPLLVYVATRGQEGAASLRWMPAQPGSELTALLRQMTRSGQSPDAEQVKQLREIFTEEFARTEEQGADSETKARSSQIKACYDRIVERAAPVLEDKQQLRLRSFAARRTSDLQSRLDESRWGRSASFYHILMDIYFFVMLPLGCANVGGSLIREELQLNTLGFLTTRPVARAVLLVVKYLSVTAWLQITAVIQAVLIFGAGATRHLPDLGALLPTFLAVQFVAVLAWCGLGTFLGLITKRYMAIALLYGLIVEMGIGRIPTNINNLSVMRHLKGLLAHNAALEGIYEWSVQPAWIALLAPTLAAGLFLFLAAMLFTFKEFHFSAEVQK
jgi:hypothetical protein